MRISDFDGDNGLTGSEGILRFGMLSCQSSGSRPIATFDAFPREATKSSLGIGMEGRRAQMARPECHHQPVRRTPFLSA